MRLKASTRQIFTSAFGYEPATTIQAPGRVNLIGEHTDYNNGFVLPCAIDYLTVISCARRHDRQIRTLSVDYQHQLDNFSLDEPITSHPEKMWANYIRGVVKHLQQRGLEFDGIDMVISGNVPQGAGLSSSASLEVAVGTAFRQLWHLPVSALDIALNGQQAENQFIGCRCGIMDQLISAIGKKDHALLLDCLTLETRTVPLPDNSTVVVINSSHQRNLAGSEYNIRRRQCEAGAAFFGQRSLRDVSIEQFNLAGPGLDPLIARRVRHVLTENTRTLLAAEALAGGDLAQIGLLMAESHISMRDDFEITVPPVNTLVDIVKNVIGEQGGVRMTGGGFGGCVVALIPTELVTEVRTVVAQHYQSQTGLKERFYVCRASAGASEC